MHVLANDALHSPQAEAQVSFLCTMYESPFCTKNVLCKSAIYFYHFRDFRPAEDRPGSFTGILPSPSRVSLLAQISGRKNCLNSLTFSSLLDFLLFARNISVLHALWREQKQVKQPASAGTPRFQKRRAKKPGGDRAFEKAFLSYTGGSRCGQLVRVGR